MKDERFTIITCSYNTPLITECMLRSYCKYHGGQHRIIVIDNSTNDETKIMLDKYRVPYVDGNTITKNKDWSSHYLGLDWAVKNCTTPNCLILDTDILFKENIYLLFERFVDDKDVVALGPHCTEYKTDTKRILPRIHSCFMMLDVEFFNKHCDLTFSDSVSDGLEEGQAYDVGSYLYKRIIDLKKKTLNVEYNRYYVHAGGGSWTNKQQELVDYYKNVIYNYLVDIDITDSFISEI